MPDKSTLRLHEKLKGKISIASKVKLTKKNLPLLYTPGVAQACLEIAKDPSLSYKYTNRGNTIAIITDGSRLLGLGNQGPYAALPVMEAKSWILQELADIDAIPLCLETQDQEKIIEIIKNISPNFAGIHLEDIEAPKCFFIQEELRKQLSIPVFHDDQDGTAAVILAGLINALKIVKKEFKETKIVILGAGAAGLALTHLLIEYGVKKLEVFDSKGNLSIQRNDLNSYKKEISQKLNSKEKSFKEALQNTDALITLSGKSNSLKKEDLKGMNKDAIIFSLSNPVPEIPWKEAKSIGKILASGGSQDYKNQVNNILSFPGIWEGILDAKTKVVTKKMIIAAAEAIAEFVPKSKLNKNHILPNVMEKGLTQKVAQRVKEAAS